MAVFRQLDVTPPCAIAAWHEEEARRVAREKRVADAIRLSKAWAAENEMLQHLRAQNDPAARRQAEAQRFRELLRQETGD